MIGQPTWRGSGTSRSHSATAAETTKADRGRRARALVPAVTELVVGKPVPTVIDSQLENRRVVAVGVILESVSQCVDLRPTRLLAVGLSIGEHGDRVEQQEKCDHEERDPRVPARPGPVPLSGGSVGVEVQAVIFSSDPEAPLPGAVTDRSGTSKEAVWLGLVQPTSDKLEMFDFCRQERKRGRRPTRGLRWHFNKTGVGWICGNQQNKRRAIF